jgi:hypothetical protein
VHPSSIRRQLCARQGRAVPCIAQQHQARSKLQPASTVV